MSTHKIYDYAEILNETGSAGRTHLLIGNGFSIGCDPCFKYQSLFETAKANGLSKRAKNIFDRLGTNNFEAVMRLLSDGNWLAGNYGLHDPGNSEMNYDLETLKRSLIQSLSVSHPGHTGKITDEKKKRALKFFEPYHNVFSLNYDLLPYWLNMSGGKPLFGDGFRSSPDDPDGPSLVFKEPLGDDRGLFYLHGALHLYMDDEGLKKHCWHRTGVSLIDSVREGLRKNRFPLFVAEGDADSKLRQIHSNGYLSYCYGKLGRIKNPLVLFGLSLGDCDLHIVELLASIEKLSKLYIGVFGKGSKLPEAVQKMLERRRTKHGGFRSIEVKYFSSESAKVWND